MKKKDIKVIELDNWGQTYPYLRVSDNGALKVKSLVKLFEFFSIPEDSGLFICDQDDPSKMFVIKRKNT